MNEKEQVRATINALYIGAGINATFDGNVNEKVAQVLGQLLTDIRSCSVAFNWVPEPVGPRITISWLAKYITKNMIENFKDTQSLTCARVRILQYKTPLHLASLGI